MFKTRGAVVALIGVICLVLGPIFGTLFGFGDVTGMIAALILLVGAALVLIGAVMMVVAARNRQSAGRSPNT